MDRRLVLARIARAFDVPAVSASDNFFDLGGDSFAALELVEILTEASGREVTPEEVFGASTFGELLDALPAADPDPAGA